jgi:uncharacterized protein YneF (UPF0154 family)
MSLFIEILLMMLVAGVIGAFIGWFLHGKCENRGNG